jgi:5-hydroxyisourate hydrolase-like protein (transthyretin family)
MSVRARVVGIFAATLATVFSMFVAAPAQATTASISGQILNADGWAEDGVTVTLYQLVGATWTPAGTQVSDWDGTADGAYQFTGLAAGTYRVCANEDRLSSSEWAFLLRPMCWQNASSMSLATDIPVASDASVTGISIRLGKYAGVIKGYVGDSASVPVSSVDVGVHRLINGHWQFLTGSYTKADGSYKATGLPPGTYRVCFNGESSFGYGNHPDLQVTCWKTAKSADTGTDIVLGNSGVVGGISARLAPAGFVSGTVTGVGASEVVQVHILDLAGQVVGQAQVFGSEGGAFSIGGLPTGSYKVSFNRASGYSTKAAQFYNGKDEYLGFGAADAFSVTAGLTTTDISGTLALGGTISGYTKRADGTRVAHCMVVALTDDGSLSTRAGNSSTTGLFKISGLTTGSYKVVVVPGSCYPESSEVDRWFDLGSSGHLSTVHSDADAVPVVQGGSKTIGTLIVAP